MSRDRLEEFFPFLKDTETHFHLLDKMHARNGECESCDAGYPKPCDSGVPGAMIHKESRPDGFDSRGPLMRSAWSCSVHGACRFDCIKLKTART